MPIYSGSDNIKEVYNGSQAIGYVYNGSQLVWQHNPYPIGTVIANTQTAGSVVIYPGQYEMKVCGSGGEGYGNLGYWAITYCSGGSGAAWEGVIKITSAVTISWTTGTGATSSVAVSIGGTNVLTAGCGVAGADTSAGGTLTKQSAFNNYKVSESVSSNGNTGQRGTIAWGNWNTAPYPVTAAPSTMGWGVGGDGKQNGRTDGGFYLKRTA